MRVPVALSWAELNQAALVGVRRQVQAIREGRKLTHGADGDHAWTYHIEGAAGEMAVAKVLGRYWSASVGTFKGDGDVGPVEVRTRSRHTYDLIVRGDDRDDAVFVLATGRAPNFVVRGWIRGGDAKQPAYLLDPGNRDAPAWFVPHDQLHPIDTLEGAAA